MSEYQYYEFQALDQPLSQEARDEMETLSSRVQLTATSATFVYNFGDFRGTPAHVLANHFDVMLYMANWGTRQLMFRFPKKSIPDEVMQAYQYDYNLEWSVVGDYIILNMFYEGEGEGGWIEGGEGILPRIASIRNDILRGDYRALYLVWLDTVFYEVEFLEEDEDLTEPPVPSNLRNLSPELHSFIDFFKMNTNLIQVAAQASENIQQSHENLKAYINQLSDEEKNSYLERLLNGEAHLTMALTHHLRELAGTGKSMPPDDTAKRRTIREIAEQLK